ncbi:MAG TPA: TolC family protein [Holophaga sp.]|nr:TolC family protein [Holophaga sp.]
MRTPFFGALACLLVTQAAAQVPLTYPDILAKARPAPGRWRAEALLAERGLQARESQGFLREGPSVALLAGPRRTPELGTRTDQGLEVDLPLFLAPATRAALEASLGRAHPLLVEAARREGQFQLRSAYLEAWLAVKLVTLREADLVTVDRWLAAARARLDAGADPAFQVALVEGERLKVQQELDEARIQEARAWGALAARAELPPAPQPLADPGPVPEIPAAGLERRLEASPLRQALLAQADLETQGLRLKEAQALSRWSLRGSYAREGEDKVARLGVAVRLPRSGETNAVRSATQAQIRAVQGEARQALAELDARAQSAANRLRRAPAPTAAPDFAKALEAVGLRLQEGRERPSDALPIRRQLLESQMAALRHIHTRHLLAAELQALLPEVNP